MCKLFPSKSNTTVTTYTYLFQQTSTITSTSLSNFSSMVTLNSVSQGTSSSSVVCVTSSNGRVYTFCDPGCFFYQSPSITSTNPSNGTNIQNTVSSDISHGTGTNYLVVCDL